MPDNKKRCSTCYGFGRYQSYHFGRVMRTYCKCPAGRDMVEKIRDILREIGADPYDKKYYINQFPNI